MQFSIAALTAAVMALGVSASPSPLEARQAGVVYVRFYAQPGCQGDWIEDTVYFDNGTGDCDPETLSLSYASWAVVTNEATRTLSVYSGSDCTTTGGGNVIDVPAGHTECYTQHIGSTQFHD